MKEEPRDRRLGERRQVAYHEAGHAVVAVWLRLPVKSVDVEYGRTEFPAPPWPNDGPSLRDALPGNPQLRVQIERRIMVKLAGGVAVERLLGVDSSGIKVTIGDDRPDNCLPGADRDLYNAAFLAFCISEDKGDMERLLNRLMAATEELLAREDVWAAVERVAEALLEKGHLRGRHVYRLWCEAVEEGHDDGN
jgi:hypothetical protein